jgi:hypothetical protein
MIEKEKIVYLHIPKTGGGAMERFLYDQLKTIRRNYFLSFFGWDDSRFYGDNLSTNRTYGNRCLIEGVYKNKQLVEEFLKSNHFKQAKMLFGHSTSSLNDLFPEYKFNYITVLREPIERTVSNIVQMSNELNGLIKFGSHFFDAKKFTVEYWNNIYDILIQEYPVRGFLVHENLYLRNCMTHILQGTKYFNENEKPNLNLAIDNCRKINISLYSNFNSGLQKSFNNTGIPIDMSKNIKALNGEPQLNINKQNTGIYYNAPKKIIDFVIENNQEDIKLYKLISQNLC